MHMLLLLVLAAHAGQGETLSPLSIDAHEPMAVEYTRGYFEYQDGTWREDHRNAFERGIYDRNGKLIGVVEVGIVDSSIKVKQSFDMANRVTDVTYYSNGDFHGRTAFTYDAQGRVTATLIYDEEGTLREKRETLYSKRGLVAAENVYKRAKGSDEVILVEEDQYAYDKTGKLITCTATELMPKKHVKMVTGYGAGGTVATEQTFNEWGDAKDMFVYAYEPDSLLGWSKLLKQRKNGKLTPVDVIYRKALPLKR